MRRAKTFLAAPKMVSFSKLPAVKKTLFLVQVEIFLAILISLCACFSEGISVS